MADFQPIKKERLLLVEGRDTEAFFSAFAAQLNLAENIQVRDFGGISDFRRVVNTIRLSPNFEQVSRLGIVRDHEYESNAFQSITDSLDSVGMPVPPQPFTLASGEPSVIIAILPDAQTDGNLEDLCLRAFGHDEATICIDGYFQSLGDQGKSLIDSQVAKAKMQMIVASKSIDETIPRRQRKVWHLNYAIYKQWWPWDHVAFDEVRDFLTQLGS